MRLINTKTLELHEFFDAQIPKYAILSHRWEGEEITFKDYVKKRKTGSSGHQKVLKFCDTAARDGYEWVWIDTCCIDKRSSAELSEAINSMYRWYENAKVCYAYLSDVHVLPDRDGEPVAVGFEKSAWFTRGWTLQELIAPVHVIFLDREWTIFGNRHDLQDSVSKITGISIEALEYGIYYGTLGPPSVAERMSWAAGRKTSRLEDIAYCLLGIFEINMPLLYGEGERAFLRLQEEIARKSDDMSLFAWNGSPEHTGILAPSPVWFHSLGGIRRVGFDLAFPAIRDKASHISFTITNKGLLFDALFLEANLCGPYYSRSKSDDMLLLDCFLLGQNGGAHILAVPINRSAVPVTKTLLVNMSNADQKRDRYIRVGNLAFIDEAVISQHIASISRKKLFIEIGGGTKEAFNRARRVIDRSNYGASKIIASMAR